jgi:hypothetical protein
MAGIKRYLITGSRGYIGENMSFKDWVDDKLKKHDTSKLLEPKTYIFMIVIIIQSLPPAQRLNED